MTRTFLRWLGLLAVANALAYFAFGWLNIYLIENYQLRRVREEAHAIITAELPRFDILPEAQWEEAARTVHQRWQVPSRLSNVQLLPPTAWQNLGMFDNRVGYDYNFPGGAFAYMVLKDNNTVLEIGPLPGLMALTAMDNVVGITLWLGFNTFILLSLLYQQHRRSVAIERATNAFLADGTARHIPDDAADSYGPAVRSVNAMASRAEQLIRQRQQMISEQRELLHAVAHECRAPLARVSFALEMLEHSESPGQRKQLSRDMETAIAELDGLVRELLTYARLQHGAQRLELAEMELAPAIDDVLTKTKTLYPTVAFRSVPATDAPPKVVVDSRLFHRALTNLVRNAACFAHSVVEVGVSRQGDQLCLTVDDDGPGVPVDQRERIFEPFARLDPSRSRDSGGAGLGLAIVRGICERHGGVIDVEDAPLGGARFRMFWPLRAGA